MPGNPFSQTFTAFFVVWMVSGFSLSAFLYLSKNAALKRRIWPFAAIAGGLVFIGFFAGMGAHAKDLLVLAPFVGLSTLINLRAMKFCDACGKTVRSQNPFSPAKFCPKCGAPLNK